MVQPEDIWDDPQLAASIKDEPGTKFFVTNEGVGYEQVEFINEMTPEQIHARFNAIFDLQDCGDRWCPCPDSPCIHIRRDIDQEEKYPYMPQPAGGRELYEVFPHECYRPTIKDRVVAWIREFWLPVVAGLFIGTTLAVITTGVMEGWLK